MATIEELQQQVAALSAQVAAITAPPTDYYTSQYDGEEIDAAVTAALTPDTVPTDGSQKLITSGAVNGSVAVLAPLTMLPTRNLLDNWDFRNPVNQRGQAEYSGEGYAIDRWTLSQWNTTSVACSIVTKGLRVRGEASGVCSTSIKQFVEGIKAGCQVTASVLVTGSTAVGAVQLFIRTNSGVRLASVCLSAPGLYSVTTTLPDDFEGNLMIDIGQDASSGGNGNTDFTLVAAKLELGTQQTLAHQDADGNWVLNELSDYGEQLSLCQRYFQTFATESLRPTDALDFRPVMRANPALSTITVGGKTLYTASADL